jgi:hypothetical protein
MRRVLAVPIFLFLLCGLALGACGGSSDTGIPTASGSASTTSTSAPTGDVVAFARCIRAHGVNVADPDPDVDFQQWVQHQADQNPSWDGASRACQNLMPPAPDRQQDQLSDQDLEQIRRYAVCMRAHGIEISDPETSGDRRGNTAIGGRLEHVTRAELENDPGYKAAEAACEDELPENPLAGDPAK